MPLHGSQQTLSVRRSYVVQHLQRYQCPTRRADPVECPEPCSFPAAHVALRLEQIAAGQWPGRGEASSRDRAARALIKVRNQFVACPLAPPEGATPARAWPLQPASSHSCEQRAPLRPHP